MTPPSSLPSLIVITGGIGSGKSVVSRVLRAMGYRVYDCDSRAKALMDADPEIHRRIAEAIGEECVSQGRLVREAIARIVFSDRAKLAELNRITHGAVRCDLEAWYRQNEACRRPLFVETAILYESGLDRMVSRVWMVTAPDDVRIARVIARNGIDEAAVRSRMASQRAVPTDDARTDVIINDGNDPILPRIESLLANKNPSRDYRGNTSTVSFL